MNRIAHAERSLPGVDFHEARPMAARSSVSQARGAIAGQLRWLALPLKSVRFNYSAMNPGAAHNLM